MKHVGISQMELCKILIHILNLLAATVTKEVDEDDNNKVSFHYDDIGYIFDTKRQEVVYKKESVRYENIENVKDRVWVNDEFALPVSARETLLGVAISLVSSDDLYRAVSNTSFQTVDENFEENYTGELLLVINWKTMLRMISRTAPYLDEKRCSKVQTCSLSRQTTILKRTSLLARYLRRFYNQGLDVKQNVLTDQTAKEVWDMVSYDLLYETHSNACFRALILLYLFHPSRCSKEFYVQIMPIWLKSWTNIDRCPDCDYLWLTMFCRARKYVDIGDYDWGSIRTRLLTLCAYWLQIPVGGKSSDKSFPNAAQAKSRSIPSRLKSFLGNSNSYQEGVDFVSRLSKLLVFCLGKNDGKKTQDEEGVFEVGEVPNNGKEISKGTEDVLTFLAFVAPYFHPSNTGAWTFPLGVFLHYLSYELCRRLARGASQSALAEKYPELAEKVETVEPYKAHSLIPDHELVLILDAMLPLCQQALYSKSSRVGRAGESALLYLTQIDHKICPVFLDFAMRALDISSVTLSHQAPAALSVLSRLVPPSLKKNPSFFLERLPEMLRLTLAGIDSNDEDKTIRTLIFYRTLTSWIPIGKNKTKKVNLNDNKKEAGTWAFGSELIDSIANLSENKNYWDFLRTLPKDSLLFQAEISHSIELDDQRERMIALLEEAALALGDWCLAFLERIYDLLRAAGEQEKVGKSHGIASRHSSADASQAKHFNLLFRQCIAQVFAAMDESNFVSAARSVAAFLSSETLPFAAKYASILCEAVCATRCQDGSSSKSGLDIVLPCLYEDLSNKSSATKLYRLRALAGGVRYAGVHVQSYKQEIKTILEMAFSDKEDKKVVKAGCKLLRHFLSSQCESYPISSDNSPRLSSVYSLGKPSHLSHDHICWHTPTGDQLDTAVYFFKYFAFGSIFRLSKEVDKEGLDVSKWRKSLKILRYSIRGAISLLQEVDSAFTTEILHPHEKAISELAKDCSEDSFAFIFNARKTLLHFIHDLLSLIASGSESIAEEDSKSRSLESVFSTDVKICKEVTQLSVLLATRRSASNKCQDAKTLWKLQKGLASDRMLGIARKEIVTMLRKCGFMKPPEVSLYNDGEKGGKSFPRRMLTSRVYIFLQAIQRDSSFEIARRLRRKSMHAANRSKPIAHIQRYEDIDYLIQTLFDIDGRLFRPDGVEMNLHWYESIIDRSFSLACHTNASVRSIGSRLSENLFSRFGWLAAQRVQRLLNALLFDDANEEFPYGVPSTSLLASSTSTSSKKRLAEVLKGVTSLLHQGRIIKELVLSDKYRLDLVRSICRSQRVISLLPAEEIQKMTHYYNSVFSKFRNRYFSVPRISAYDVLRLEYLEFLVNEVNDECKDESDSELTTAHWRDRLVSCWFLLTFIEKEDLSSEIFAAKVLKICLVCVQEEVGQPIQKLALGLLGRLSDLFEGSQFVNEINYLQQKLGDENFCADLGSALVFNHKEDRSIGGGHRAQWSVGVESILRDAQSNLAPRTMFPFKRMGRSSSGLILQHVQLLSRLLKLVSEEAALDAATFLLSNAKTLASAPPSEDQRNSLMTCAEIFAGVADGLLSHVASDSDIIQTWHLVLLPFFEEVMKKIPSSALGAYSDAIRFIIQYLSPSQQRPLVTKIMESIDKTLWKNGSDEVDDNVVNVDGFAEQSKWVGVMCAILIELDMEKNTFSDLALSGDTLPTNKYKGHKEGLESLRELWYDIIHVLLPRLIEATGHPYQKCREQIAWCLFCICNCFFKLVQQEKYFEDSSLEIGSLNPGKVILEAFQKINEMRVDSTKEQQLGLTTVRFFLFYCLHYGDNKNEYAEFILPLLPLAFEAVKPNVSDEDEDLDAEVRMLQAQVVKGFRHSIAEISASSFVTYNKADDITAVLKTLNTVSHHDSWQVRHTAAHFLRCFHGCHKFLLTVEQSKRTTRIVARLLADDRKEVSTAVSDIYFYISEDSALHTANPHLYLITTGNVGVDRNSCFNTHKYRRTNG